MLEGSETFDVQECNVIFRTIQMLIELHPEKVKEFPEDTNKFISVQNKAFRCMERAVKKKRMDGIGKAINFLNDI